MTVGVLCVIMLELSWVYEMYQLACLHGLLLCYHHSITLARGTCIPSTFIKLRTGELNIRIEGLGSCAQAYVCTTKLLFNRLDWVWDPHAYSLRPDLYDDYDLQTTESLEARSVGGCAGMNTKFYLTRVAGQSLYVLSLPTNRH